MTATITTVVNLVRTTAREQMPASLRYRPDIDGLRGIAVLAVVAAHAGVPGMEVGVLGVDLFFVISGYLITSIIAPSIAAGTFSISAFYARRLRRLIPALVVVLAASVAMGWILLLPAELRELGQSTLAASLFLSNVHFLREVDYFATAAEFRPLLHTWSLSVEEQFYLLFPWLLVALAACKVSGLAVVAGISSLSMTGMLLLGEQWPGATFYMLPFRAWELGAGAILALAAPSAPTHRWIRNGVAIVGGVMVLSPILFYASVPTKTETAVLAVVLGGSLLLYVGEHDTFVGRMLRFRPLVGLGLISYSLYLWHWPIYSYLRIALDQADLPPAIAIGAGAASMCLAGLTWRFVEQRFRTSSPGVVPTPRPGARSTASTVYWASGTALAACAATGVLFHVTGGVPSRWHASALALAAASEDLDPRQLACSGRMPGADLCEIGATDTEASFLLWGDSHAGAILPGLDLAAKAAGYRGIVATHTACPPLLDLERRPRTRGCATFKTAVIDYLRERPGIERVVLAARWTLSVEGTRFGGEGGAPVQIAGARTASEQAAKVSDAVRTTLETLSALGRDIVVIGPVPEAGHNVPLVSARMTRLGWGGGLGPSAEAWSARSGTTADMLSDAASNMPATAYLPLGDLFCAGTRCATRSETGAPLYVDDDHLSRMGAETLLPNRLEGIWPEDIRLLEAQGP